MSGSIKVQAYLSFYDQGMTAYNNNDFANAKALLLRAAEIADNIAQNAITYNTKIEYAEAARKLLEFVKKKCNPKQVAVFADDDVKSETSANKATDSSDSVDISTQKPIHKITFDDVAGLDEVKEQVQLKVLAPMQNAELAKAYKIECGGRILLYGPPGTGKTYIAKAIAGEVDAEFFAVDCSDLISKYMGDSSKQIAALFEKAQKHERAIIFFDEIDAITSKRSDEGNGVDSEMARFVSTFLTRVDGFISKENRMLLLIAATNRPWAIDTAMLRGGRFDTHIYVGVPDTDARLFLVKKAFAEIPVSDDLDLGEISEALDGFGGGDIVSICKKIIECGYKRALKSGCLESITKDDCISVISRQRNVITKQMLEQFKRYEQGGE